MGGMGTRTICYCWKRQEAFPDSFGMWKDAGKCRAIKQRKELGTCRNRLSGDQDNSPFGFPAKVCAAAYS